MKEFIEKHLSKMVMAILTAMMVWMFDSVMDMRDKQLLLEQKILDDQAQWQILKETLDKQTELNVKVKYHDLLLETMIKLKLGEIKGNDVEIKDNDIIKLQEEIDKFKKHDKKSVEEFRDEYIQQQLPQQRSK